MKEGMQKKVANVEMNQNIVKKQTKVSKIDEIMHNRMNMQMKMLAESYKKVNMP